MRNNNNNMNDKKNLMHLNYEEFRFSFFLHDFS